MSLTLSCPSCGARHELRNPGVVVVVCQYCQTTLYREEAAFRAGKRSVVAEPRSRVFVGATGRILGTRVHVSGRVQFGHGAGRWDEWLLETPQGDGHWLVEDEKAYTLESVYAGQIPPNLLTGQPGSRHIIEGTAYLIRETGTATCVGGEGQLPRDFEPGESYRYVDAVSEDGSKVFTVEVNTGGGYWAWTGQVVPFEQVAFTGSPPHRFEASEQARSITCPQCGGSLSLPTRGERPLTLGCTHCAAVLNLADEHPALSGGGRPTEASGANARNDRRTFAGLFALEVGAAGEIGGNQFEVMGRLLYEETGSAPTIEYLLWSEKAGYRWLASYRNQWTLSRPVPTPLPWSELLSLDERASRVIGGRRYKKYEHGSLRLRYVDGALPWEARIGEATRYITLVAPPLGITVEQTGTELESFQARHIDGQTVLDAFGRGDAYKRPRRGFVGALQPNLLQQGRKPIVALLLLFGLFNLWLAGTALISGTTLVNEFQLTGSRSGHDSRSFEVKEGMKVLGLHYSSDLQNDWVYLTAEFQNPAGTIVLGEVGRELSYYSGRSGGESWSEGSRTGRMLLRAPPPGSYRLYVRREGSQRARVQVRLTHGPRYGLQHLMAALLLLGYPLIILMGTMGFENRRWG